MDNNYFVITKTVPGNVVIKLSPITNTDQKRVIKLTEQIPSARLPKDWALGIFLDPSLFNMFKKGVFTFDKVDEVTQLAIAEQVYFGDELEFKPRSKDYVKETLAILKSGKRMDILAAIKEDADVVVSVAQQYKDDLTAGTLTLIEKETGKQIQLDEG